MAMTNAERQRRYRVRMKARASGDAVVEHVQEAVERAILVLWAYHERPGPTGVRWSDIDGCRTIDDYRESLAESPGNLVDACRAFLPDYEGLTAQERPAIATVVELANVLLDASRALTEDYLAATPEEQRAAATVIDVVDALQLRY